MLVVCTGPNAGNHMPSMNRYLNGMPPGLTDAWEKLAAILKAADGGPGMAVAFSGGLDSRFLVHACLLLDIEVLALHFTGPHIQPSQTAQALLWLEERKIPCVTVRVKVLEIPQVRSTAPDRCYHCKYTAFHALGQHTAKFSSFSLEAISGEESSHGGRQIYDGTLFSDLSEYRPGWRALQELKVRSPLAEAGLGKEQVRALARALGLDNPEQPSQTCLLTRFDYGLEVDAAALELLAAAEEAVAAVLAERAETDNVAGAIGTDGSGVTAGAQTGFRVRLLNDNGAALPELHLQMAEDELCARPGLAEELRAALERCGLSSATIRAMPKLSGFFDRRNRLAGGNL